MEEEINEKVVSLGVRTGKLTASVLARAMRDFLDAQKTKPHKYAKGKQSFKHLMEQNAGATNIEVDASNIKAFEKIARKYHIDYSLKKDKTLDPPKYLVFFKSRDLDAMNMAFKEFIASINKQKERTPFREKLAKFKERAEEFNRNRNKNRDINKDRHRRREKSL